MQKFLNRSSVLQKASHKLPSRYSKDCRLFQLLTIFDTLIQLLCRLFLGIRVSVCVCIQFWLIYSLVRSYIHSYIFFFSWLAVRYRAALFDTFCQHFLSDQFLTPFIKCVRRPRIEATVQQLNYQQYNDVMRGNVTLSVRGFTEKPPHYTFIYHF